MTHLDDVDDQAAAVAHVLAGHVGADDAAVLLRRGLDGVHGVALRDEITALGDVAGRVDVRDARAQAIVDDDALIDLHAGGLEPLEIRPNARRHDHHVGDQVAARGHLEPPPALRLVDPRELGARANGDAVVLEPGLNELGAGIVDHPRQDPRRDLDDRQLRTERQDRVEDRERDEAGADHDHVAARPDLREHAARLVERPEGVHARAVGARNGRADRGRAGRDQAVVVLDGRPIVQGTHVRVRIERRGAPAQVRRHAPVTQDPRRRGEHVRLGDRAVEVVRQDHPRVGLLGAHQSDRRLLGLLLANRADRVHSCGAAADDQVPAGHQRASASTRAVRSRAKSPSQSAVSTSS